MITHAEMLEMRELISAYRRAVQSYERAIHRSDEGDRRAASDADCAAYDALHSRLWELTDWSTASAVVGKDG